MAEKQLEIVFTELFCGSQKLNNQSNPVTPYAQSIPWRIVSSQASLEDTCINNQFHKTVATNLELITHHEFRKLKNINKINPVIC